MRSEAPAYIAIFGELGPQWLDLGVWLVHARSGYAAMNFSIEKTVSRDRM